MNKTAKRLAPTLLLSLLAGATVWAQAPADGETRALTLQQAVALALRQNPDYLLARLEEQRSRQAIAEARAPFIPQIAVGSGLAYSNGFPLSISGSAPSIFQAYGSKFIYNRPQSMRVREAAEMATAASRSREGKAEEIAYRVAANYLDFERATRAAAAARSQLDLVTRIEGLVRARVEEGRLIPLDLTRARVETARARAQVENLQARAEFLEDMLRADLGLDENVRIAPVESGLPAETVLPETEESAVADALANSPELKRLQATLRAKEFDVKAEKGAYFPRIDLVAQYAMLGRYNNYEEFFKTFQRNNGQLGMSFQVPLLARSQISARLAAVQSEISQVKLQISAAQSNLAVETRRLFREVRQAETARDLARMELDLARETLSVYLARLDEGRISMNEVEQARVAESQKWEAFYDAQTAAAKARLNLLRETGTLVAALR